MAKNQKLLRKLVPVLYYGLAFFGAVFVFYQLFVVLRGMMRLIFRKKQDLVHVYGAKSWVLVTGSSEGIGKEFALQFAADGFNIILLARRQAMLQAVKQEIIGRHPSVQVQIIVADLEKQGQKQNINDVLPALDRFSNISIVVNNAGIFSIGKFTDISPEKIIGLLNTNCFALAAICYKFIPYFERRIQETGKKCGFINVGSCAGQIPLAYSNIYSASKAYIGQLTNNLSKEYPKINWLLLKPMRVTTAMTFFLRDRTTITVKECVTETLKDFGYQINTNGHIQHKIQSYLIQTIPSIFNYFWENIIIPKRLKEIQRFKNSQK